MWCFVVVASEVGKVSEVVSENDDHFIHDDPIQTVVVQGDQSVLIVSNLAHMSCMWGALSSRLQSVQV